MRIPLLAIVLAVAVAPQAAEAQVGYTFNPPVATLSLRVGLGGPAAQDDLFEFFTETLTLNKSDFRSTALAADLAFRAMPQLDIVLGIAYDASSNRSEFVAWVDQDDQPIEQTTKFSRLPLTLSAKYYVLPRGRSLSRHAWVPVTFTPYVTLGGGYMLYDLVQQGDFVDYEDLSVFSQRFASSGGGATVHAGAGGEWWFTPRLGVTAEGRYAWGSAGIDRDFSDEFERVDLRGFQVTTGLAVRF